MQYDLYHCVSNQTSKEDQRLINTIYKVHVTKKEKRKYHTLIKKTGLSYLRQIGKVQGSKNVQCAQNLVTGCESKNMMEFAVFRIDWPLQYECYTVKGTNARNGASFVTVMPLQK